MFSFFKKFFLFFLISLLIAYSLPERGNFSFAQNLSPEKERELLEKELKELEKKISQYEKEIEKKEKEKNSLKNRIYILKKKIKKLDLQIYQSKLVIDDLSLQIQDTERSINETKKELEKGRERLKGILRMIYEQEQRSLIEVFLAEGLSEFFDNLADLEILNIKNRELLKKIKSLKNYLEKQKEALDEEKEDIEKQLAIQTLQRQESLKAKREKEYLLRLTEAEYQKYLQEKEKTERRAQQIRSRLFELVGITKAPTFGQAYQIAKYVSSITGVRPALLLAVLTQESNIGKNVGQCYLKNPKTGEGVSARTGRKIKKVMNPKRDVPYFLQITKSLGRDPYSTPVSCPMKYGWGGAMGPAQFIPSTWANPRYGYGKKVEKITGKPADPWNIRDAFLAAGIYLKELGATKNEFKAVMRYFSGSKWSKWEEFYGRSVLKIAAEYEKDIEQLEKSS